MSATSILICRVRYKCGVVHDESWEQDWPLDEKIQAMVFQHTEGNYSCDCNKAMFIAEARGEQAIDAKCGDAIEVESISAVFHDGTERVLWKSQENPHE